jgi:hypothetical protein
VTLWKPVGGYQRFGGTHHHHLRQNVGKHLQQYMALEHRPQPPQYLLCSADFSSSSNNVHHFCIYCELYWHC